MKRTGFQMILLCVVLILASSLFATAQSIASESEIYTITQKATVHQPIAVEYHKIPGFCFGHRQKNDFVNFNQEQLNVLADYQYPKFVSRGTQFLESDILAFQKAVSAWEVANSHNITAIRTALGFAQ